MTNDPVCGVQLDEKKALASSTHKGQHYFFCGQACKDKFDQNPERYIGAQPNTPKHEPEPHSAR